MKVPLQITWEIPKNEAIENLIIEKVKKLEQVCPYLSSCRVTLDQPQKHQENGHKYRVRIDMTVPPSHELYVTSGKGKLDMHLELAAIVRGVFKTARRELEKLVEKQRREVKLHPTQATNAIVNKIFHNEGFGFLKNIEGQDVYFHQHSVLHNDFERMEVGTGVWHSAETGEKGLQATTVRVVDKPGVRINR
jgi:cold shock CspA family protein